MTTRTKSIAMLTAMLLISTIVMVGCTSYGGLAETKKLSGTSEYDETDSLEPVTYEMLPCELFKIEGNKIIYSDDIYSLSWDSTQWTYQVSSNGCITLERGVDLTYPLTVEFSVISEDGGIPSDMWAYVDVNMEEYYAIPNIFYYTLLRGDMIVPFEGCTGIATGVRYDYPDDESLYSNILSVVYAVTNAENSAVVAINSHGSNEAIESILSEWTKSENFYAESHKYVKDVLPTFILKGNNEVSWVVVLKQYRDKWLFEKTNQYIGFYPREFYCLDNFSSFKVEYNGHLYSSVEEAYQAAKFEKSAPEIAERIRNSRSAHEAQKIAADNSAFQRKDWNEVKVKLMNILLHLKVEQNPYVMKKLLETVDYLIVEDSPKDSFWGCGKDRNGENMLGKLWMSIRAEYRK